jgi:hypothetical protein
MTKCALAVFVAAFLVACSTGQQYAAATRVGSYPSSARETVTTVSGAERRERGETVSWNPIKVLNRMLFRDEAGPKRIAGYHIPDSLRLVDKDEKQYKLVRPNWLDCRDTCERSHGQRSTWYTLILYLGHDELQNCYDRCDRIWKHEKATMTYVEYHRKKYPELYE